MRRQGKGDAFGRGTLRLIAAVLAVAWTSELQANDVGRAPGASPPPAQTVTSAPPEPQAAEGQDHQNAKMLARELAATKNDLDVLVRLLNRACDESTRAGPSVDTEAAESRKVLQEERDRGSRLEQDLAAARRDVEVQTALAAKSSAAANQMKKTADNVADLRKALQQERDRGSRLEQDLAAARRDVETQTALAAKASAEANQLKSADAGAADLRKALQQERDRASRLEQDLAAARHAVEVQTAPAAKANDEAARPRQATESGSAEPRQSLQQDPDRAIQLMHDLVLARSHVPAPSIIAADQINTQQRLEAARPVAAEQAAVADTQPEAEDTAEVTKLVAYARVLLGRGDIGSARTVLQRAVEMGSAQAIFTLAETYDPLILSKWGTYGTRGDATRALDYYARALAGGIQEAKERSDALNR